MTTLKLNEIQLFFYIAIFGLLDSNIGVAQYPVPQLRKQPQDCLDLKRQRPGAASGIYQVYPNGLDVLTVYCDMDYSGGGWTLIGRGRENWAWNDSGLNTANVPLNVGTSSAFVPAYYSAATVDLLLKGIQVKNLKDGIRIKRAAWNDASGASYQEGRWYLSSQNSWTWLFDSSLSTISSSFEGTVYGAGNTYDYIPFNDHRRIFTWEWASHNNYKGFSYGSSVTGGANNATSFLWEYSNEDHAIPYTEVYVRAIPIDPAIPTSCLQAFNAGITTSGPTWIQPASTPLVAYCDMTTEGGGYTYYPVNSGISTASVTADNSCKTLGMDIVITRSKDHWTTLFSLYDSSYFSIVPVYKTTDGGAYTTCYMRSPAHYGSGCSDWRVVDGGRWWLRDSTFYEPSGDSTAYCFLGLYDQNTNALHYNDSYCNHSASSYICSTNDKP